MSVERLVRKSKKLRERGAYDEALELARQACDQDRRDLDAWTERAASAEHLGQVDEAASALFSAGDLLAQATKHARAYQLMERVLTLMPDHRGAVRMRAWLSAKIAPRAIDEFEAGKLAIGTVPIPAPAPDLERDEPEPEAEGFPETRNYARATAVANAAMVSPLLLSLRSDALVALSHRAQLYGERESERVYTQGSVASTLYFVINGRVTLTGTAGGTARRVPGELFGAESLLFDTVRSFAAVKDPGSSLLELNLADVRDLIHTDQHAREVFVEGATREIATAFAHANGLAQDLGQSAAAELVAQATLVEMSTDEIVIERGARPPGLLFVMTGEVESGDSKVHGPGAPVGANWLLSGEQASHSIRAKRDGWLLLVPRSAAAGLLAAHPLLLERLSR